MATFTLAEAKRLGLDDLQSGIVDTILTASPGLQFIPFTTVAGNSFKYLREVSIPDGQIVAADGTITDSSALTTKEIMVGLTAVSGQSDIPNQQLRAKIGTAQGNDLKAVHIAKAAKGVTRALENMIVNGTVAANGFDGLKALLTSSDFSAQVVDAANAAFDLSMVDDAASRVLVGGTKIIMGNGKAEMKFKQAMRAAGGTDSVELNGKYFTAYDGMVFVRNDWIAADNVGGTAGNQTDIYILTMGDGVVDGGGVQALTSEGELFHLTEFPSLEMKDATRERVIVDFALTVGTPLAVALIKNVTV